MISDWPETLPHRIDQITNQKGDHDALADGAGEKLTYSDMTDRIEAIAEALQNAEVRAGSRVLVFQQPTVNWTCSMLAIMRIGAVYVPLDLRNPISRLATIAKDCEAVAVLAHAETFNDAPQLQVDTIINVSTLPSKPSARIANHAQADTPAAILYTSGSTGSPKGIVVTHKGLRNEIEGYTKTWELGAERVLQQSAMTFNHSSDQMYTGLVNGGMVYVVPADKRGDPIEIANIIQTQGITYTKATPSEYLMWLQYGREMLRQASKWRFAFGGGEQLTATVTDAFASLGLPDLRFYNSYGPTEISISSHKMLIPYTDAKAVRDLGRLPCGYSLPNYHTYIVDEQLKPVPVGMPGEICIGGAGVSLGYLNNKELTGRHFVQNTLATAEDIARGWTRMYRTGDIGYLREDGAMVFQSRVAGDTQVKIRGIRIELSDIESSIVAAAGGLLREAVVTIHENDMLVAHVVFAQQHDDVEDKDGFLDRLLSQLPLPQYMVPVVAIPIDKLPMNNHSKVDRKAVQKMTFPERVQRGETFSLELSETMLQLRLVWRQVLGQNLQKLDSEVTPSTDFFLVGGNSLLAIRLQAEIRKTFTAIIPLVKLLDSSTLGAMARVVEESMGGQSGVDWEDQTRPPVVPYFLADVSTNAAARSDSKKTFLITGATGFTAHYLIPKLAAREDVGTVHCVALRTKKRNTELYTSPKVVYHSGDLMSPLLGLSEDKFRELASEVDTIIHMGGVRGYFDNYLVLRPSNVHPTRELVKLAAPRHIPIHYFSTIGVLPREAAGVPGSAADFVPALDGNNGYAASKWASERVLERSGADLGVPSTIYRFVGSSSSQGQDPKTKLLLELERLVRASNKKPDMKAGWSGHVEFVPVEQVSEWLVGAVTDASPDAKAPRFIHYESPISIDADELRVAVSGLGIEGLELMPLLKWFGHIKTVGFNYLLTSQDTTVDTTGTGENIIESRR
jgi:hybrid polyketide synthase/nonribosomal peptide synthetase ACE1